MGIKLGSRSLKMVEFVPYSSNSEHLMIYLQVPPRFKIDSDVNEPEVGPIMIYLQVPPHFKIDDVNEPELYSETIEVGPTNSLYLHVDVDGANNPIGVEILDADDKLTDGWRDRIEVCMDEKRVTFGEESRVVSEVKAVYMSMRAYIGYDVDKRIVKMRFEKVHPSDIDYDMDRFEDLAFEEFIDEKWRPIIGRSYR